jgi:hypothetical protein
MVKWDARGKDANRTPDECGIGLSDDHDIRE